MARRQNRDPRAPEIRESGMPGGGAGRRDYVGGSGVWPASAGIDRVPRGAEIRTPAAWGQGERGPEGYYDSGTSELFMYEGQLLGGYESGMPMQQPYGAPYGMPYGGPGESPRYAGMYASPTYGYGAGTPRSRPRDAADFRTMGGPIADRPTHAGRGPKGYRRSDERLLDEIVWTLTDHPAIDPTDVHVHVKDGVVTFTGTVEDRIQRHLLEDVTEDIFGVTEVRNEVSVRTPRRAGGRP